MKAVVGSQTVWVPSVLHTVSGCSLGLDKGINVREEPPVDRQASSARPLRPFVSH